MHCILLSLCLSTPGYGLCEGCSLEAFIKGPTERAVVFLFAAEHSITVSRVILMGHSFGTEVAIHHG